MQERLSQVKLANSSIKITMDTYGYLMPGLQDAVAEIFNQERIAQEEVHAGA